MQIYLFVFAASNCQFISICAVYYMQNFIFLYLLHRIVNLLAYVAGLMVASFWVF